MIQGNKHELGGYIIIESHHNRVFATRAPRNPYFDQVTLEYRPRVDAPWEELAAWVDDEWREGANAAFEAILGVIGRIAGGEVIETVP